MTFGHNRNSGEGFGRHQVHIKKH